MKNLYLKQIAILKSEKPSLLVQVCCAPDLVVPLLELKEYFKLYLYWYNPNIQPYSEYKKRYREYIKLLNLEKWDYEIVDEKWNIITEKLEEDKIYNDYNSREFYNKLYENKHIVWVKEENYAKLMKDFSKMEEKNSIRCDICYYTRLLEAAKIAKKLWIKYFTTTLLISPKKSIEKLDKYGEIVTKEIWIQYLSFNFIKDNWFQRAAKYTRENNIRRQNYCWCAWSKWC
jgi:predicted adenine nucleotide alpha hydrolase (AANH) superfamily ATPase